MADQLCSPRALAAKIVTAKPGSNQICLLVASRHGRGEPSLVMTDDSAIILEGEDGVREFLCVPPEVETEINRSIRTNGLLVFCAEDIVRHGINVRPLTLLKI